MCLCGLGELNLQERPPQEPSKNQMQLLSFPFSHRHQNGWIRNHHEPFFSQESKQAWTGEQSSDQNFVVPAGPSLFKVTALLFLNRAVESWGVF